jgi:hypothetical protein
MESTGGSNEMSALDPSGEEGIRMMRIHTDTGEIAIEYRDYYHARDGPERNQGEDEHGGATSCSGEHVDYAKPSDKARRKTTDEARGIHNHKLPRY